MVSYLIIFFFKIATNGHDALRFRWIYDIHEGGHAVDTVVAYAPWCSACSHYL